MRPCKSSQVGDGDIVQNPHTSAYDCLGGGYLLR
jgi:hypothetical protein